MRIRFDPELCQGHGRCYMLAPDLFDSDDYGHCVVLQAEVPEGREADARSAADNCPEKALSVE